MTILSAKDDHEGKTDIVLECNRCDASEDFTVPTNGFTKWMIHGVPIQVAMPSVGADDRESILLGWCTYCVDEVYASFGEDE